MPRSESPISRFNAVAAAIAVAASLLLPPGVYLIVARANLVASMVSQAQLDAAAINVEIIGKAPQLWQFQEVRLNEMMSHRVPAETLAKEYLRVVDSNDKVVAAVGTPPPWPIVARSQPLFDAGRQVGRLEIQRSFRPLLFDAAWLSLFGLLLAVGSFVTLRVIPLRAVLKANEDLRQRDASLAFANTLLTATTEGTLDAILIVDRNGRITSYNQHFIDLWQIPRALVEARIDEPVLAAVVEQQRDPPAFLSRVRYLYDHPEEAGSDRLELKDGRLVERFSRTLYGPDQGYLGRAWFFRDVTERERAAEETRNRLKRTQAQLQAVGQVGQAAALLSGDVEALAREITELASRASGCERVNVWLFNEKQTELHCIDLFEATPATHSSGMVLHERDFRHEIGVIKTSKYVNADDPLTDPRTKGYAEGYLKPLRITSMLDAVIQAGDQTFGLLCLEHVDKPHHWEEDEIAFASQLADKIGLAVISRMRRQAEAALQRRDALLHATAVSAAEFVTAPSLDEAIHRSLALVSQTIHIDRMNVLERPPTHQAAATLRYAWHAPNIQVALGPEAFENPAHISPQIAAWLEPLSKGKVITADASRATGDVKMLLESIGTKSTLVVPITVDGKYWGHIAFDSCAQERTWPDFEVDILKTLADLIGNAIQRDRYVKEIADANRIVQNTPTILYRMRGEPALPMIYISQNIKLFGYEPAVLTAAPELYKSLIHPDDLPGFHDWMSQVLEDHGQPGGVGELRMLTSRGEYRWFEDRFSPIRDANGRLVEIEGLLIDITERKAAQERIALLARTDPLTGLANRTTFIERLHQLFAAARRGAPHFAVLYLDVDRFKDINDTLGHPIGDRLLVMVGERLKNNIRETDLVARFGGDEFSILQTDLEDTANAGALASKLRSALAEPMHIGGNELRITASIGISVYAPETAAPEDLLAQADVALYRAKDEGRDQYRFHTKELDIQVREEVALTDELRAALGRDEFKLYYQPQVELSTGRIVGMEALIRWDHPARGMLPPSKFLPVAERTGMITAIGAWVLDQACQQMRQWQDAGIAPQTVAVNLSSAQIKTGNEFVQFVTDTLKKWRLVPANLELDVTESMLARAALAQNDVLERLQALGVNISIDDFGTKYSSLDYLRTYRVNRLKIPKPLIEAAARNGENAAMVRAIAGIARELNIEVIAQGVETEDQWSYLAAASPVSKVQGFYYSAPVPPAKADELLRQGVISPAAEQVT